MFSYTDILKKAYHSTLNSPALWLFGLLVVGGFNLNFLHYGNLPMRRLIFEGRLPEVVEYFQFHPGALAAVSFGILVFTIAGLIATNWSRIMLILLGRQVLEKDSTPWQKNIRLGFGVLWVIVKISLLTSSLMLVVAAALFGPTLLLQMEQITKLFLLESAVIIFLPLAFAISCINIFTSYYVILFKQNFQRAINLGIDFFVSRWSQILGLVAILMVIYFAVFMVGVSLIFLVKLTLREILEAVARVYFFPVSAIILMLKVFSGLLFWLMLGALSAFFNQALLILFLELNDPIKNLEYKKVSKPLSAHNL